MSIRIRTKEEIDRQIKGLQDMKTWLPQTSIWGDDNWVRIDKQIEIVSGDEDFSDMVEDEELLSQGLRDEEFDAAQEADDWLNFEGNYSEGTEDLFEEQ